jgi:chromosome partitioning protein
MAKNTVAILNQKGGVGKTTTVLNLSAYLADAGKSVLVVDLDPQGNTTSGFSIDKHQLDSTLYDVLFSDTQAVNVVRPVTLKNVYLLPANAELASAEVDLVQTANREFVLKKALDKLEYDIILIDCPPSLGLLTINALSASSDLLIPVQTEYYAMEGLSQLLSVVQEVKKDLNPNLNLLGVVLTMYDSRTSLSDQVKNEIQTHFGSKVFKTVIPRNIRLAEAPSFGKTILEHDSWSKGARAYKALAKELESKLYG